MRSSWCSAPRSTPSARGGYGPVTCSLPFIEDVALTPADRASYRCYADTERYQPSEQVHPTFDRQSLPQDKP
jgi:hypothetical protein